MKGGVKMYKVEDGRLKLEHGSINEGLIAVASGKGGVGKSTVTVNLAVILAELGKKVGIIDADIHGFSVPRLLGLKELPKSKNEKEIIPPEEKGIKVMSMGSFVNEDNPVIWRGPLLFKALQQFMKDVHWGDLDYLLLDLPPGTGDMPLNIMQKLPHSEILIVTTPQIVAINVAGRIGRMAEKLNAGLLGIIENMSYYQCPECGHRENIFGQGGGRKLAKELKTEFLGELPLVSAVRVGGDEGKPIIDLDPDLEIIQLYRQIVDKIIVRDHQFTP
jgi:ATP-binding protein involved in chromosome partitioning